MSADRRPWRMIANDLSRASLENQSKLACEMTVGDPLNFQNQDARRWVRGFLRQRHSKVDSVAADFMLLMLSQQPALPDVSVAERQLPRFIDGAARVIINGAELLTPVRRRQLSGKVKTLYRKSPDPNNLCGTFVETVVALEGKGSLDWLCQVLETRSGICPAFEAYKAAKEYSPKRTVDSLLKNLKTDRTSHSVGGRLHGLAYLATHLLFLVDHLNRPEDIDLLATNLAQISCVQPPEAESRSHATKDLLLTHGYKYPRDLVRSELRQSQDYLRKLLSNLDPSGANSSVLRQFLT